MFPDCTVELHLPATASNSTCEGSTSNLKARWPTAPGSPTSRHRQPTLGFDWNGSFNHPTTRGQPGRPSPKLTAPPKILHTYIYIYRYIYIYIYIYIWPNESPPSGTHQWPTDSEVSPLGARVRNRYLVKRYPKISSATESTCGG